MSEVARRGTAGMSPALAQLGISIAEDEAGRRMVSFPAELAARANVLLPIQEITQGDPNWTPSLRMVRLDVEAHSYTNRSWKGMRALNKQGLEILGQCAGITAARAGRIPRAELDDTEIGYYAEVGIRRSDGTIALIRREKAIDIEDEKFRVEEQIDERARENNWSPEYRDKAFRGRWIQEKEHLRAKCETKAVLRAYRAALQIPHQYTAQELAKPFLVIGYAFTPDTEDPEVRRMIAAHGLAAADSVYGAQPFVGATEVRALPSASDVVREDIVEDTPEPPPREERGVDAAGEPADTEAAAGGSPQPAAAAPEPEREPEPPPYDEPPEPPVAPTVQLSPDEVAERRARAGAVVIGFGRHSGETIAQIADADPEYPNQRSYVHWLARNANDEQVRRAAAVFMGLEGA